MANKNIEDGKLHAARVGCRLTTEEHQRLTAEAEAHGVTLSQLVRSRIVGTKLASKIDARAIAELRRQGGLLKHLVGENKSAFDPADVRQVLQTIKDAILAINHEERRP